MNFIVALNYRPPAIDENRTGVETHGESKYSAGW